MTAVVVARLTNQGCRAWLLSDGHVARPASTKRWSALSWTESLAVSTRFTLLRRLQEHCITRKRKGQHFIKIKELSHIKRPCGL